ncbi:MAG: selenocysteine-specific translation elongation factor [Bacillota bacterium]|jgi:selenocysteine-specific elongation factor
MIPGQGKHIIIGTAGHVDHGKTQLVKRITGIDTDRLKEEKERGISIELGFAPLTLPSGLQAGIVDVPGHERFIKHMLAGATGIDLVLLVVAADEGVMPQTREHLDIINLLEIKKGLIVLTKKDLVDQDWLLLVEEDIRETVKGTVLAEAEIVAVSSKTGEGMAELLELLDRMAAEVVEKEVTGKVRLPIDRVFSITGFGTVVTGTLFSGRLKAGDTVEILPEGYSTRVRGLQVHGQKVDEAKAGQRVAINLTGLETRDIRRGSVLLAPGYLSSTYRLDVQLELLASAERAIKNWTRIRFHLGTREALGRVVLLEDEELAPGNRAFAQLVMEEPVVAARRDRFVLRSYSPMFTIGGGTVIDPNPPKQKRFRPEVIQALTIKEKGTPEELILQDLLHAHPPFVAHGDLSNRLGLTKEEIASGLERLQEEGRVVFLSLEGSDYLIHPQVYADLQEDVREVLGDYHREFPLRPGLSKEELRSRKFNYFSVKLLNALLQHWEEGRLISLIGQSVAQHGHRPQLTEHYRSVVAEILRHYQTARFQPPAWGELRQTLSQTLSLKENEYDEILNYCLNQKLLVKVADDLYFRAEEITEARETIINYLKHNPSLTISEARELLGGSRKYILPLLEYFDREKLTRRSGDKRVLY